MLFGSPLFLFVALPLVIACTLIAGARLRNLVLLLASLVFYAWGEPRLVGVLLVSILVNHAASRALQRPASATSRRLVLTLAVAFNVGLLALFKLLPFAVDSLAALLELAGLGAEGLPTVEPLPLPLGLSFFTFQALSHVIDAYRRDGPMPRGLLDFATYLALFPQLIAGPIVRFGDVAHELVERRITRAGFSAGLGRFVLGLGKKVLIADVIARAVDPIFAAPPDQLTASAAWLGTLGFGLQITFDFAGYSDMAIGLGAMLGFRFPENFREPFVAKSVTDFWRRWHITLARWFRDYVYVPLGGNRVSPARTLVNLLFVFALVGLWHGARWTFVVWGLYHGAFLLIERALGEERVARLWSPLAHVYVLLAVGVSFALFRADDLGHASAVIAAMFGGAQGDGAALSLPLLVDPITRLALAVAVVGCLPWTTWLERVRAALDQRPAAALVWRGATEIWLVGVLVLCLLRISVATYTPFLYFRF